MASSRAQASTGQGVEPPPPSTDPLQPPQGDVVVDQTADRLVYQDPSTGQTTARVFGGPVAYLDPSGAWKPLNNELQAGPAGGYVNAAGRVHLNFATSSDAAHLVQLTDGDNSVSFGLNGGSQSPASVSGDTITYPAATGGGGADLQYQVLAGRVKETLVLNQVPSGDGPVVYDFPLQLHGLTPRVADDGDVQLVDAQGTVDFTVPDGIAIDSSSPVPGSASTSTVPVKLLGDATSGWTVEVQPDTQWLRSPDRVYPAYIDPSYTWSAGSGSDDSGGDDAYISSGATTTNYDGAGQLSGTKYVDPASLSSGVSLNSDAHYDLSWLSGRSVSAASWYGYVFSAASFPAGYQLQPLNGSWTETGVTWATQPSTISGASVTGSATAASTWFSSTITSWVQNWAAGTWSNNGIVISHTGTGTTLNFAADESSQIHVSYIQVTYNSYPTTPNFRAPAPSLHTNQPSLQLSARVKDPDGGTLHGDFELWSASTGGTLLYSGSGSTVSSGSQTIWTTPTLTNGTSYYWDVRGDDGSLQSVYTTRRSIHIDTTPPATPGISSSTYTSGAWNSAASGPFTFTNGGSSDVAGWQYSFTNQDPVANETSVSSPTVTIPSGSGWHTLYVRSFDTAGNLSTASSFAYGVTPGGVDGLSAGLTTQKRIVLSADATSPYDGFALQYRRADNEAWTIVPASDVTYQSSGLGISSWPVTMSGTPDATSVGLVWDAATSLSSIDGPLQLRAQYFTSGVAQAQYSDKVPIVLSTDNASLERASEPLTPGRWSPVTGNLTISASDVAVGQLSFGRTYHSRSTTTDYGVFGPGWESSLGLGTLPFSSLIDNGDTVVVMTSDNQEIDFSKNAAGTAYVPASGSAGYSLAHPTTGRFEVTDISGLTVGFEIPVTSSTYAPVDAEQRGMTHTETISWQVNSGAIQPTTVIAAPADNITCAPTFQQGCRELLFNYATSTTATGTTSSQWGDENRQLKSVQYKAWDTTLTTPGFVTDTVATYLYDINARLRAEWDPRVSPSLKTTYDYDGNGELSTLTPPGTNAWTLNYTTIAGDSNPGRLSSVQRQDPSLGTATTTVSYQVPMSGSGAPYNLSASEAARWAQQDLPTDAAAIFPPEEVPSSPPTDYNHATVYYTDVSGLQVNIAQPGGDISTTEYDPSGDVVRQLSAANRARALNASTTDSAAAEAVLARQLDTQDTYSANGTQLQQEFGPAHNVTQPAPNADQIVRARLHTTYTYDASPPTGVTCPCNLVTGSVAAAAPLDGSTDVDSHATAYDYSIGSNNAGWTLGQPLQTVADPSGVDEVSTTIYDPATGLLSEARTPAGSSGGDARSTGYVYYTALTNSLESSCGNIPAYAGLLCEIKPVAQPGTSGIPDLPVETITSYDRYDLPLTESEAVSGGSYRTITYTYDSAERSSTQTIASNVGTSVFATTITYDSVTGLPGTIANATTTVTKAYDADGRLTSYTDGSGNTTTVGYDLSSRPDSVNDGKGSETISYDDVGGEARGLPTTVVDSGAGTFTATYDASGALSTLTYPGGLTATHTYDEVGQLTDLSYAKSGSPWLDFGSLDSILGIKASDSGTLDSRDYSYDGIGRLTAVADTVAGAGCVTRDYTFDADSDRTARTTINPNGDGSCASSGGSTLSSSYDTGDRNTTTGYAYDALGRETTIPAAQSPSASTVSMSYFANDRARTIASGGDTRTYALDAESRVSSWTDSTDGQTRTAHYLNDSGGDSWQTDNTSGSAWSRKVGAFGELGAVEAHTSGGADTVKLQLMDPAGNLVATADPSASIYDVGTRTYDEYGQVEGISGNTQYGYSGGTGNETDTNSGLVLMGARVYNSSSGAFAQTDPVDNQSQGTYTYVGGDPVNRSDPNGTFWYCRYTPAFHGIGPVQVNQLCPAEYFWVSWRSYVTCLGWCYFHVSDHKLSKYEISAKQVQFAAKFFAQDDDATHVFTINNIDYNTYTYSTDAAVRSYFGTAAGSNVSMWEEPDEICMIDDCFPAADWFYMQYRYQYYGYYCPAGNATCVWYYKGS